MPQVPVSLILAVRNGAEFIGEALQSVLAQTCPPRQVIVIDDGSTDETRAVVGRFPQAAYVWQPPLGQAEAKNHGVRLAAMPYITFLDADDLWAPTKTEVQFGVLSNNHELDFVSGLIVQFQGPASQALTNGSAPAPGRLLGMLMMRRQSFWKVGPFSTDLTIGDPVDWWARAADAGLKGATVPSVALLRRVHDNNVGRATRNPMGEYLKILHSTVKRRRDGR